MEIHLRKIRSITIELRRCPFEATFKGLYLAKLLFHVICQSAMNFSKTLLKNSKDGISSVIFSPSVKNELIAGCWDGSLLHYQISENPELLGKYDLSSPILSLEYTDEKTALVGNLDGTVTTLDLNTRNHEFLGNHGKGVSCISKLRLESKIYILLASYSINILDCFISGSWDKSFRVWDVRVKQPVEGQDIGKKIFASSSRDNILVLGCSERENLVYDIRNLKLPFQRRPSSFKYMTRSVCCNQNFEGFVSSSIEGRTSVEYINPSQEAQSKNFTFKCHRQIQKDYDIVYPVNDLKFHPIHQTLATAGGDGVVAFWDIQVRKRLRVLNPSKINISSISFNVDGSMLAIATCAQEEAAGNIYVHALESNFAAPKLKS